MMMRVAISFPFIVVAGNAASPHEVGLSNQFIFISRHAAFMIASLLSIFSGHRVMRLSASSMHDAARRWRMPGIRRVLALLVTLSYGKCVIDIVLRIHGVQDYASLLFCRAMPGWRSVIIHQLHFIALQIFGHYICSRFEWRAFLSFPAIHCYANARTFFSRFRVFL